MSSQLDSVRSFVGALAPAASPVGGGQVVVVGSGKGGVGTSTVSALLALMIAERGSEVLLVDAADGHGAQHLLLGVQPELGLASLRGGTRSPGDLIVPVAPGLSLIPSLIDTVVDAPLTPVERRALFRRLGAVFGDYGTVVIDGGSRLDSVVAACEAGVGLLLAVTAADRICLAATYALVKALGLRLGDRPIAILANRLEETAAREAAALVDSATRHFLDRPIDFAGSLPDDACLLAGIAAGMPIQDAAAYSPAARAMQAIAGLLLTHNASAGTAPLHLPLR